MKFQLEFLAVHPMHWMPSSRIRNQFVLANFQVTLEKTGD